MAAKGILGRKLGMTQIWDDQNRVVPVTVIEAGPCRVVQLKTPERDGYSAVQLAFGDTMPQRLSKPELGHLKKADAPPAKHLAELRVDDLSGFEVGQVLGADLFEAGERVDVSAISKGKGFAGDAAPQLQGPGRQPRQPQEAPGPRLHRRVRHARPRVQGHEDGRPDGQHARHHAEPRSGRGRRRTRPPAHPRVGPGPAGGLVLVRNAVKGGPVSLPARTVEAPVEESA